MFLRATSRKMKSGLKGFLAALQDLCFPPACLSCTRRLPSFSDFLFCVSCAEQVSLIHEPLCPVCGKGFPFSAAVDNHCCSVCIKKSWQFARARGIVYYTEPVTRVIHAFKYGGKMTALHSFASLKSRLPHLDALQKADLILPVPLHAKRLRDRGFNQALLLANAFFPHRQDRIEPRVLERVKWTEPQTGLNGAARRQNLKNAFAVRDPRAVRGKKLLLVDDVFTTGTTVNECARVLRKSGAQSVDVLCLARVKE